MKRILFPSRYLLLFLVLGIFPLVQGILAQSAWTPYEKQLWVRPMVTYGEYDSAFLADYKAKYDDNVRINGAFLSLEYGITDRLTVDATSGFGRLGRHRLLNRVGQQSPEVPNKYGWFDHRLGIRYKILDEFDSNYNWMPTISVRVGALKKGDYDRNPQALGDGANGSEVNVYIGKDFNFWGLGALGELGRRWRENPVPDDMIYYGGLYKRFLENFMILAGVRGQTGLQGYAFTDVRGTPPYQFLNIPVPDITDGIYPNWYNDIYIRDFRPAWGRREHFTNVELGLGFIDKQGNFYNLFVSRTVKGFNTAELTTVGLLINFPFQF